MEAVVTRAALVGVERVEDVGRVKVVRPPSRVADRVWPRAVTALMTGDVRAVRLAGSRYESSPVTEYICAQRRAPFIVAFRTRCVSPG